jgi:hypothetical protein
VFAYFDETRGGADGDLTAVAGYLFDRDGVARFLQLYQTNVEPLLPPDKYGRKMFHAASLYAREEPFFPMQKTIRDYILARMAGVIRDSVTMGCVVGIEDAEYDLGLLGRYGRLVLSGHPTKNLAPWVGSKYSLCLLRCIQGINHWMDREGLSGPVEYTFESGCASETEATTMLSRITASSDLGKRLRWDKFSFAEKSPRHPWLFAADYFAWEWQRYDMLSKYPDRDEWRTVMLPLIETKTHLASYLTQQSVSTQALINLFYGVMGPFRPRVSPKNE